MLTSRLNNEGFMNMMRQVRISLLAVDESHCISQVWLGLPYHLHEFILNVVGREFPTRISQDFTLRGGDGCPTRSLSHCYGNAVGL